MSASAYHVMRLYTVAIRLLLSLSLSLLMLGWDGGGGKTLALVELYLFLSLNVFFLQNYYFNYWNCINVIRNWFNKMTVQFVLTIPKIAIDLLHPLYRLFSARFCYSGVMQIIIFGEMLHNSIRERSIKLLNWGGRLKLPSLIASIRLILSILNIYVISLSVIVRTINRLMGK